MRGELVGKTVGLFLKSSGALMVGVLKAVLDDEVLMEVKEKAPGSNKERSQEVAVFKDDVAWWKPMTMRHIEVTALFAARCIKLSMSPEGDEKVECKGKLAYTTKPDEDAKELCTCAQRGETCKTVLTRFTDFSADKQAKLLDGQHIDLREKKVKASVKKKVINDKHGKNKNVAS